MKEDTENVLQATDNKQERSQLMGQDGDFSERESKKKNCFGQDEGGGDHLVHSHNERIEQFETEKTQRHARRLE